MAEVTRLLHRYTEFTYLLNMLESNTLRIPNCQKWVDVNDRFAMSEYRRANPRISVHALCMTSAFETYHHWKIYTSDQGGVCLKFSRTRLEEWAQANPGTEIRDVKYIELNNFVPDDISVESLPFVKRVGYHDEQECRIVCKTEQVSSYVDLPFPTDALVGIAINPHVSKDVSISIKMAIKSVLADRQVPISHSELVDSQRWQDKISEVVDSFLT